MAQSFKTGDKVTWQSRNGEIQGEVIKEITKDTEFKGVMHRASAEHPQYEVKSDKTGATAMHKAESLQKN